MNVSIKKNYDFLTQIKFINHRENTKKHWHIFYYVYDEIDEVWKSYFDQVNWFIAMYYKMHKVKKLYKSTSLSPQIFPDYFKLNPDDNAD